MSPDFAPLYTELTQSYTRIPQSRWFPRRKMFDAFQRAPSDSLAMVVRSVRRSLNELGYAKRLRSDGYHFLVVNMHQMVALPVLANALEQKRTSRSELQENRQTEQSAAEIYSQLRTDIEHDVHLILSRAGELSEDEISGRAILEASSQVYEQLKTAASNVWG